MTLFRRENGIYYVKITEDGRVRWKSTGCRNKSEALRKIRNLTLSKPESRPPAVSFTSLTDHILTYTKANYADRTHELYKLALRHLREFLPNVSPGSMTAMHADRFKIHRLKTANPTTVNIELRTLKSAFNLAVRWGLIGVNPFIGVQQVRTSDGPPTFMTKEQFSKLLVYIDGHWIKDVVVLAVCTGMRQGEILHLEWRHVDLKRRVVHVTSTPSFRTKTGKGRIIPLNDLAVRTLSERPRTADLVFMYDGIPIRRDSLTKAFKRAVREAGLPEAIHFHSLRHTFASWLVQDGVSLYQVGRLLGHTDSKTTEIYAHLQPETMHDVVSRLNL